MQRRYTHSILIILAIAAVIAVVYGLGVNGKTTPSDGAAEQPSGRKTNPDPAQAKAFEALGQLIAPTPATAEDWKKVQVMTSSISVNGAALPYGFALHLQAVLEAEKNMNASHARVSNQRSLDGITTSIWSRKANNKLVVNWGTSKVVKQEPRKEEGFELGQQPPKGSGVSILFGVSSADKSTCIGIAVPIKGMNTEKETRIPYDYSGYTQAWCYAEEDYPVAVLPKIKRKPREPWSILIIDISNTLLLGEIELPPEARGTGPVFSLDMENDVLVGAGYNADWLLAVDLKPYMDKLRQAGWKPPVAPPADETPKPKP